MKPYQKAEIWSRSQHKRTHNKKKVCAKKYIFYNNLRNLSNIQHRDTLILMVYFNARVGNDHQDRDDVLCHHGVRRMVPNGLRLLSIWCEFNLVITNAYFQQLNSRIDDGM